LGSVFYSVKEKNFDDSGRRRQHDKEFSKKAELEMEMARQRDLVAKREAESTLKKQVSSGGSRVVVAGATVPHTPRVGGFGQTPRKRVGL
jgi:pre-mRNA-splicing factor ATP-dependent RNA helicase DHX38/PRP16